MKKNLLIFLIMILFPFMGMAAGGAYYVPSAVDLGAPGPIGDDIPNTGAFTTLDASGAITGASVATDRTDAAQVIRLYEATSDGDSYTNLQVPAKGTGLLGNGSILLPDYSGGSGRVPLLVARTRTAGGQNLTTAATVDVTGSTVVIPASTFIVGKQIRFVVYGRIAGTTDAKTITMTEGTHSLAVSAAAALNGSFRAEFVFSEVTALTAQQMYAGMVCNTTASVATNAENDLAMNAEVTLKLTMTLANAADDIFIDGVDIYFDQI